VSPGILFQISFIFSPLSFENFPRLSFSSFRVSFSSFGTSSSSSSPSSSSSSSSLADSNFHDTPSAYPSTSDTDTVSAEMFKRYGKNARLQRILKLSNLNHVKERLSEVSKQQDMIEFELFVSWCDEFGINREDATAYAQALEETGQIILLDSDSGEQMMYLRPDKVLEQVMQVVDVDGKLVPRKQAQIETLKKELVALDEKLDVICKKATRSANLRTWGVICYVVAQTSALARMTWWDFSWDLVEPVTYFVTMSGVIVSLMYFGFTKREWSSNGLYSHWYLKKEHSLWMQEGIPLRAREDLLKKIETLERQVRRTKKEDKKLIEQTPPLLEQQDKQIPNNNKQN